MSLAYIRRLVHSATYLTFSNSQAWRKAWWSQWSTNINGASNSCIPCRLYHTTNQICIRIFHTRKFRTHGNLML